jgi:hypothetical protein
MQKTCLQSNCLKPQQKTKECYLVYDKGKLQGGKLQLKWTRPDIGEL